MSRWRCGVCAYIVDMTCWQKSLCPKCGEYEPDESWAMLPQECTEYLYQKQIEAKKINWLVLKDCKRKVD